MIDITELKEASLQDIFEISIKSAQAKSKLLYIYEKSDLTQLLGQEKSDLIRQEFLKNKTKVLQITNLPTFPKFTENDEFISECMNFHYVPKALYPITLETLIFDDYVVLYTLEPTIKMVTIKNREFANNQRKLFETLWKQGLTPKFDFAYTPNHSFYNSIDFHIGKIQLILWPDKDAPQAYKNATYAELQTYFATIISEYDSFFQNVDYLIAFIWSFEGDRMVDIWKFNGNYVDDRSGPLSEAAVFRNGKRCTELGLASGNTLMVLGYEETLRRQKKDLADYLNGDPPELPLELLNGEDFFQSNH